MVRDQIILGIDPGTTVMGYGLLQVKGNKPYLVAMGVLDPTKVTRTALQNAASVAGLILTTDCMVADIPEDKPAMPPVGMDGGMGGMM